MLADPPFNILSKLDRVDDAIDANADIASEILATGLKSFGLSSECDGSINDWHGAAKASDMDKVRITIRQLYRDWSADSAKERGASYGPVLEDISTAFDHVQDKSELKVLVPGAGLGRLVFEICKRGYTVEGNEISYHQLLASNWVLNHTEQAKQFDLYPFIMDFSNVISREHQFKAVKIPDVHPGLDLEQFSKPARTHPFDRMSMTAADFVTFYGESAHRNLFDAVVTVFFIDTAPNVMKYVEVIRDCLKEGGVWINLGPLLWHFSERGASDHAITQNSKASIPGFGTSSLSSNSSLREPDKIQAAERRNADVEDPGSVELSNDEVLMLIEMNGFEIEKHEVRNEGSGYIQNPESMLQNMYRTSHWVARKKPRVSNF